MSYGIDMNNITGALPMSATNFGAQLLRLAMKAGPHNMERLRTAFPNAVKTVEEYRRTGEILDLPYD